MNEDQFSINSDIPAKKNLIKIGDGYSNIYLDELKEKESIGSDLALAKTLGVSRAFISAIRSGKRSIPLNILESIFVRLDRRLSMQEAYTFIPLTIKRRTFTRFPPDRANAKLTQRSNGRCELCNNLAPFESPPGSPYLFSYHFYQSSKAESTLNTVALCPNCHEKMSNQISPEEYNPILEKRLRSYNKTTRNI